MDEREGIPARFVNKFDGNLTGVDVNYFCPKIAVLRQEPVKNMFSLS